MYSHINQIFILTEFECCCIYFLRRYLWVTKWLRSVDISHVSFI